MDFDAASAEAVAFRPIGVIRTRHLDPGKTPIQPCYAPDEEGLVELFPEYAQGLKDLEGYSHIYLLYHHHKAGPAQLLARPCLQDTERGIFSTRRPCRPNPIGMSIVRLLSCEGGVLRIAGADMLDGTPLLDIKPYSRRIDCVTGTRDGWQDQIGDAEAMAAGRAGGIRS